MPTYTYECPRCGYREDIFHSVNEDIKRGCSRCGERMRRLIGVGAGLIFKGDGFYITDYASGKQKTTKESGNGSDKNEGKSQDSP